MKQITQKIPFLRLTFALASGIILAATMAFPPTVAYIVCLFCLLALFILQHFYSFRISDFFGAVVLLFFVFLGVSVYSLYNNKPVFFTDAVFSAVVLESPVEKTNSYQSVLKIESVIRNDSVFRTEEKILAYFSKSNEAAGLQPGEILLLKQTPQAIKNNGNPFEFNYKNYLARDRIYRQVYLPEEKWQRTSIRSSFSLRLLAWKTRMKLLEIYRSQDFRKNELDILSALTLGYKREIDPETKRVFSSAGAMHVLAVSGLHVGIIFLILRFILGFLKRSKTGRILFVAVSITILWAFAFLTGLSPSVSRAATMFTFVVLGNNLNRQTSIYNTLAGSALFLLLVNPNNLFDVGFQLSYSAVFGIVFLQPKLDKLASPPNKLLLFFWRLLTVSIAAQIATLPITLFYFGQFPAYFWVSNLFVIPAAFVLIPLGFMLLFFHSIPLLSTIIFSITSFIIRVFYLLLQFIENLPGSVWKVYVTPAELVFILGLMVSLLLFIEYRRKAALKSLMLFTFLLMAASLFSKTTTLLGKQIIVYNNDKNSVLHLISGRQNYIVSEKPLTDEDYLQATVQNTVKMLRLNNPVMLTAHQNYTDEVLVMNNKMLLFENKIILIDADISAIPENLKPDFVVNPQRINEITLNDTLNLCIVTNRRYISGLAESSHLIYQLNENGAFIKKW